MIRIGHGVIVAAAIVAGAAHAAAAEQVGVPACDAYLVQYDSCITTKIPEAQRAPHRKTVDDKRKGWIDYGNKNPSLKSSLEQTCKTTMTMTNMMLQQYGCELK